MSVANLIRGARIDAGFSQHELAARAGTSQPALARYETGEVLPTLPTLERVLLACGQRLRIDAAPADGSAIPISSIRAQLGPRARALKARRSQLLAAARAHGVSRVRVFGSVARGEATTASDVDLLVDLAPGRTLLDLLAFRRSVEQILAAGVDVATEDMLRERDRPAILIETVPL